MVAINRPKSLKNIINIAGKVDNRQHDRFVDKKTWSKPIPKNKPQFKKDLMEFDVTEKKILLRLGETVSFKTKLPKKTIKVSEEWIEMIEEPETATEINHENLSWTACSDD